MTEIYKKNVKTITVYVGINREHIRWLFQWIYNVRIIKPQILVDKYDQALKEMVATRNGIRPFKYRNIFEPTQKNPNSKIIEFGFYI